jgi:hypothetical protein
MDERVHAEYGAKAGDVVREIRGVLDSINIPQDVSQRANLQEISALAERLARLQRPSLDDDVCRAIGNYVSYSYR